jgi:uncharacterized phage protein (TIGR01671 family)
MLLLDFRAELNNLIIEMNRVIKFRVWHKNYNKFYYLSDDDCLEFYGDTFYLIVSNHEGPGAVIGSNKNCILQQFSGLKDKNGKEIYEGDIIRFMGRWDKKGQVLKPNYEPYEVLWFCAGLVAWRVNKPKYQSFHKHNDLVGVGHTNNEVIGNIFENPELLKNV